jgi:hypothetical protein
MARQVRGALFADYVRMIHAHKEVDWSKYLDEEDLPYQSLWIDLDGWYPMETYERMGLAILENVAQGDLGLIRRWGRETVDVLYREQPDLFAHGDPRETFSRFQGLRQTLFNFLCVESRLIKDGKALLIIDYGMSPLAEEAACHQSIGFMERLMELSGAEDVEVRLTACSWKGDERTVMEVLWRPKW